MAATKVGRNAIPSRRITGTDAERWSPSYKFAQEDKN